MSFDHADVRWKETRAVIRDLSRVGYIVQVRQEEAPDFVSACAIWNRRVCHEDLNLPHEAGDEQTSDLVKISIGLLHFTAG
jgi:hypothetical protein